MGQESLEVHDLVESLSESIDQREEKEINGIYGWPLPPPSWLS